MQNASHLTTVLWLGGALCMVPLVHSDSSHIGVARRWDRWQSAGARLHPQLQSTDLQLYRSERLCHKLPNTK